MNVLRFQVTGWGIGLEAARDTNHDGIPDVIVGEPGAGKAYVYSPFVVCRAGVVKSRVVAIATECADSHERRFENSRIAEGWGRHVLGSW